MGAEGRSLSQDLISIFFFAALSALGILIVKTPFLNEASTFSLSTSLGRRSIADIGARTLERFKKELDVAKMVLWNGPMGVFESEPFAGGTLGIARKLAEIDARTIVGGGDTGAAVSQAGVSDRLTHVSTGGGAFLKFLEGRELPAIAALQARGD